jgi:hypothetical protein
MTRYMAVLLPVSDDAVADATVVGIGVEAVTVGCTVTAIEVGAGVTDALAVALVASKYEIEVPEPEPPGEEVAVTVVVGGAVGGAVGVAVGVEAGITIFAVGALIVPPFAVTDTEVVWPLYSKLIVTDEPFAAEGMIA